MEYLLACALLCRVEVYMHTSLCLVATGVGGGTDGTASTHEKVAKYKHSTLYNDNGNQHDGNVSV